MANFYEDDIPAASYDYEIPADFDDTATGTLQVAGQTIPGDFGVGVLDGSWDTFTVPAVGKYPIYAVISLAGRSQRFLVDHLIVQDPDSVWYINGSARVRWPGAPTDDGDLYDLLEIARGQVLEYAPAQADTDPIPAGYVRAQLMQARNIWNAATKDSGDQIGGEGFSYTVFPMDWSVKNLIRPKRGVPVVG